jgi:hypothetical protein
VDDIARAFTCPAPNHVLGVGHSWRAESQQLTPSSPAGGYTGLKFKSGTLTFSHAVASSGNEIVVPAGAKCTLWLELPEAAAAGGSGAGQDGRNFKCDTPPNVTIEFGAAGARIIAAGKAQMEVYGTGAEVDPLLHPSPVYNAALARIGPGQDWPRTVRRRGCPIGSVYSFRIGSR